MRAKEYIDTPDLGCWIEPNGSIHSCDHNQDIHHADIALEFFDIDTNDDGEHDEYSRDAAIEAALDEGWLRVSAIDTMGFSVNWEGDLTPDQLQTVKPILAKARRYRFDQYYISNNDYLSFARFGDFLRAFRERTNSA